MSAGWNQWQQPAGEESDEDVDYSEWTKSDLQQLLEHRALPKTGTKDELVARLRESDE